MSIWLERHAQALLGSLGRLARAPFASLLTVLVIGIALALPAALWVVVQNLRTATSGLDETVQLSAYLEPGTGEERAREAAEAIAALTGVREVHVVSPEDGLAEFRERTGMAEALEALPENPLPWLVQVVPGHPFDTAAAVRELADEIRKLPRVELVEADTEWIARLRALEDAVERLGLVIALVLGAGVLAVVGNTIRLEIHARRAEIEVTKLVGGSNAFVRRPFLYSGLWQGLGGGLVAVAIVCGGALALDPWIGRLAEAYGSDFRLVGLGLRASSLLAGAGAALGLIGAWLAAGYHLRRVEPRA